LNGRVNLVESSYVTILWENFLARSKCTGFSSLVSKACLFQFKRATVQNSETGQLEPASYRISKVAWLSDEEHPVIGDVVKRIEDLTGLTASTAEELQVLNYGIGGHYEPHCDFAQEKEKDVFTSIGTGNRIATFLFYVSSLVALSYA